jgi:hypothetical protein
MIAEWFKNYLLASVEYLAFARLNLECDYVLNVNDFLVLGVNSIVYQYFNFIKIVYNNIFNQ